MTCAGWPCCDWMKRNRWMCWGRTHPERWWTSQCSPGSIHWADSHGIWAGRTGCSGMILVPWASKWPQAWSQDSEHIDRLMQERRNSSALAMELRLSCTNPPNYYGCSTLWPNSNHRHMPLSFHWKNTLLFLPLLYNNVWGWALIASHSL